MTLLRSTFFALVFFVQTALGALAVIIIGFVRPFTTLSYRVVKIWARSVLWAAGVHVRTEGLENLPLGRSYVLVSNHQSHMDIPVLFHAMPMRISFVAKKELFRIPVFAQGMRAAGMIEIDRSNRNRAVEALREAAAAIRKNNISLLAFPEGTRSASGDIMPFKKGAVVLAIHTGLPIAPISIRGTYAIHSRGRLTITPGTATVVVHPPVETGDYSYEDRNRLLAQIHQQVSEGFYAVES